jgi:hypothetical protein
MKKSIPILQWRTAEAEPIQVGDRRITAVSQALVLRLPFGGFVWNRPAWVTVEQGGQLRRIWIIDYTRLILWGLGLLSLVFGLLAFEGGTKNKRR